MKINFKKGFILFTLTVSIFSFSELFQNENSTVDSDANIVITPFEDQQPEND